MFFDLPCGCKVKLHDSHVKDCDTLPSIEIDYYNLKDCPLVWKEVRNITTKGVFQLEKSLGQQWVRKIEPNNVEDLSALTALIRPGVLENIIDGKNLTQHYADRKTGKEKSVAQHPALNDILKETYHVLTYQEQAGGVYDHIQRAIRHRDIGTTVEIEITTKTFHLSPNFFRHT
jgi:DNA polymerase III alpha subunit